jgi:hypothetical protein
MLNITVWIAEGVLALFFQGRRVCQLPRQRGHVLGIRSAARGRSGMPYPWSPGRRPP